jgi:hypothetical protein
LRPNATGQDSGEIDAPNVADALESLNRTHPELRKHLFPRKARSALLLTCI